jgi:hypothetical protein
LDNDNFGGRAVSDIAKKLIENGFQVHFVRPPQGYKDWNEMLQALDQKVISGYVQKEKTEYSLREEWKLQNWPM